MEVPFGEAYYNCFLLKYCLGFSSKNYLTLSLKHKYQKFISSFSQYLRELFFDSDYAPDC
uniref:Uncharacterized protein n=1 Tax=Octopus bimaculoides TaxID=37653 RepID=A0A0L8GND5_OCTBM